MKMLNCKMLVFVFFVVVPTINGLVVTATPIAKERNIQTKVLKLSRQLLHCQELISERKNKCKFIGDLLVKELPKFMDRLDPHRDATLNKIMVIKQFYTDCNSIIQSGIYGSNVYPIWLKGGYRFIYIQCDMESGSHITNRTGWITFQQRKNGKINFNRGWEDYVNGFGNPNEDYWAGLETILLLTWQNEIAFSYGYRTFRPNLRVDLEGWDGFHAYVEYKRFYLNLESNYRISGLSKRFGTAFQSNFRSSIVQNEFSTFDHSSEAYFFLPDCPGPHNSGWWFLGCSFSNLNGVYQGPTEKMSERFSIFWYQWSLINPNNTALKHASMKIQF
ncbi:microfibril-associated glycoprotein 4-like [Ciona intestinalis]